ncbi:hypothetical protein [Kaistella pullorum]|uniref:Uncharacterized protein n=1 Tax=Kaistella pullorum TaxID=2763074 RepID=A0ABR8WPT8_9FLAO|nr:hypothetical protein [Kaistella pullorum]MBD8019088.1 hypothetical protein [Kaistella pullorum]
MSNIESIYNSLEIDKPVFIYDDFEQVVIKLMVSENNKISAFAKHKGRNEYSLDPTTKLVYNAELGGEIVNQEFYDNY